MKDTEFIESAIEILQQNEKEYKSIMEIVKKKLISILDGKKGVSVSGRIKEPEKLREKIYRKNYMQKYDNPNEFVKELPDGIGIRVICMLIEEEKHIFEKLRKSFKNEKHIFGRTYLGDDRLFICFEKQPETQKNKLDIYRMDAVYQGDNEVKIEIQIKSLTHYFWGEIEHSLFYKNYDYTLHNDFYSNLMKNIHVELENIDSEMSSLIHYMDKSYENRANEVKQIGALLISEKYASQIEKELNCKIDLREVYALLVDIHFGLKTDIDNLYIKLSDLMNKIKDSDKTNLGREGLINCELKLSEIAEAYLPIAKIVDENIKSGDVFWHYFYLIYRSLFKEINDDYSDVIAEVAKKVVYLYREVSEIADALLEYDMQSVVNDTIVMMATKKRKIDFFLLNSTMGRIKKSIEKTLLDIQSSVLRIEDFSDEEVFEANKPLMKYIMYVTAMCEIDEIETVNEWTDIVNLVKSCNDYSLKLSDFVFEAIEEKSKISEEDFTFILSELKIEKEKEG